MKLVLAVIAAVLAVLVLLSVTGSLAPAQLLALTVIVLAVAVVAP